MSDGLLWVLPFVLLLGSIAVFPLVRPHWWEKKFPFVTALLAATVIYHYVLELKTIEPLLRTTHEYVSFICLIGALFIVSGGIHITVKGEATPLANSVFLLVGAVLANFLGTTGASMVLIRPWIRMNKYRITSFHVIFFIFLVSNIGGSLTPIGDPPLFLGYLRGVPFFWVTERLLPVWSLGVLLLVGLFYLIDRKNFMRAPAAVRKKETAEETWRFEGLQNVFFLLVIIGSVFIQHPPFLREAIMAVTAVLSYRFTSKTVHERNEFNFNPIREVAILFAGIFITMLPALEWLEHHASALGLSTAGHFFWASGVLSSVLDNAPTYLNFLSAALGLFEPSSLPEKARVAELLSLHPEIVRAISAGSVFFGAMTYIGNGPNFLVKSIAHHAGVKTPDFFGYILRYSAPILLPLFALVWLVFFR